MSTETTNKKIKIDNGTTFGRTYTDKAVDELLKNAGGGGTSVIELTDKNGTIASAQLGKINANPQNFAFKYNGKILLFTRSDSTTYQYCNNTTSSSDNNVMTTSTLLTITSSTGAYTIAENVHNVVANSIHPANGGDLTNIQVGSKVYSISTGGGSSKITITATKSDWTGSGKIPHARWDSNSDSALKPNTAYEIGDTVSANFFKEFSDQSLDSNQILVPGTANISIGYNNYTLKYGDVVLALTTDHTRLDVAPSRFGNGYSIKASCYLTYTVIKAGTTGTDVSLSSSGWDAIYSYNIYTIEVSSQ